MKNFNLKKRDVINLKQIVNRIGIVDTHAIIIIIIIIFGSNFVSY